MPTDCDVQELKRRIDAQTPPLMLDVRQPEEVAIASIPGAIQIPMGEIPFRLAELEAHADSELVVFCHHGMRSAMVQQFLLKHDFLNVRNLIGGIDAYSAEVDPSIPRY